MLNLALYSPFPEPAILPCLQHLLLQPWSRLRKGPLDRQRERLSDGKHEGHAVREMVGEKLSSIQCHPPSARWIVANAVTVEALIPL
jgi:hypothetical protein